MQIILQSDHPNARDREAKLLRSNMPIGREIYRVRGGYLACLEYPYCLAGVFDTADAAAAAQQEAISWRDPDFPPE